MCHTWRRNIQYSDSTSTDLWVRGKTGEFVFPNEALHELTFKGFQLDL